MVSLGGAALEGVLTSKGVRDPHSGVEIRHFGLKDVEVAMESQQDEAVLLGVAPAALLLVGQQTFDNLGDQAAEGLVLVGSRPQQGIQNHSVRAALGMQQQIGALFIDWVTLGESVGILQESAT